jgi:glutamate-1-semialdehyde 2,1-aminomutase
MSLDRSLAHLQRARAVLAGGVSSSVRLAERPHPLAFARASGAEIEDLDGHRYIDYVCGYGPIILGHADPRVTEAVAASLSLGQAFGGQHPLEIEVAERIRDAVPSMQMMRFSLAGSEAVHAAIRVARAVTGRPVVVRFDGHYHGWLDTILAAPLGDPPMAAARPATLGQPQDALTDVVVLPWNDPDAVAVARERLRGRLAAVIFEPILCNTGVIAPRAGYVEALRVWCDREHALLIADEVITGFRVGLGGGQGVLGFHPDLSVFGKAVANGFPLSVIGGRRELLDGVATAAVLHAGTFNGNVVSMAAARATLDVLAAGGGAIYGAITATGRALMDGLARTAAAAGVRVLLQGPGPVFHMWFTDLTEIVDAHTARTTGAETYTLFVDAMLRRGVRLIPQGRWYVSAAHTTGHVERTIDAARAAFADVAAANRA